MDEGPVHVVGNPSGESGTVAWHPVVVRGFSTKGTTTRGWVVVILAALLVLAIVLIKDVLL